MITLNQHTNKMCVNWYDQDGGKKDEIVKVKRAHGREEKEHSLKVYSLMSRSEEWKKEKGGKKGRQDRTLWRSTQEWRSGEGLRRSSVVLRGNCENP